MKKRGLSTVVTTLIIILLVLVAIGIVWVVVRNIIQSGVEGVELSAKCLNVDVKATAVVNTSATDYDVTLTRTASGEEIAGVKLVFFNATGGSSSVIDVSENIAPLATVTKSVDGEIINSNKVEVTAYFKDTSGNEKPCSQTTSSSIGVGNGGNGGNGNGGNGNGGETYCGDMSVQSPNDAGTGGPLNDGNEECDGGTNCGNDPYSCSCPAGYVSDGSNGCMTDPSISCDEVFDGNEECDGGVGCMLPGELNECTCQVGYIPTDPASADCVEITSINSGIIDNVWPPGTGIYFDSDTLPKEDGLYYGKAAFFPTVDNTRCFLIVGYSYDSAVYSDAIVELNLFEPLAISSGDDYEIWESMAGCQQAQGLI